LQGGLGGYLLIRQRRIKRGKNYRNTHHHQKINNYQEKQNQTKSKNIKINENEMKCDLLKF